MHYKAIIFDCDGTLVDSERVGNAALVECAQEVGIELTLEMALRHFRGRKMADTLGLLEQWLGGPLPENFLPMVRLRMATAFEERLTAMEGVHELLSKLSVPICVASNGPHEKMEVSLRVTGLSQYFADRIYSAYDCNIWKPDPGLFHYAAREMGADPSACAVVEDSIMGVEAAVSAGMTAFGYAPQDNGQFLAHAGAIVFHHMKSLEGLLGLEPDGTQP